MYDLCGYVHGIQYVPNVVLSLGHSFLEAKKEASSTSTLRGLRLPLLLVSLIPSLPKRSGRNTDAVTISTGTTIIVTIHLEEEEEEEEEEEGAAFGGFTACFFGGIYKLIHCRKRGVRVRGEETRLSISNIGDLRYTCTIRGTDFQWYFQSLRLVSSRLSYHIISTSIL